MIIKKNIPSKFVLYCFLLIPVVFSACTMYQPEKRNNDNLNLPQRFTMYSEKRTMSKKWWDAFGSKELDSLISIALKDNLSIAETYARVEQAWATAVKQGAAKWPTLNAKAGSSITRNKNPNMKGDKTEQSHSLGLSASYEIDLWGKIKSRHLSAGLDLQAAQEDIYTAAMTLSSEVALAWFEIIAVSKKLVILHKQLQTNETMLELTLFRYRKGQSTALDVFQQKQTVARNRASFPQLEARLKVLKNELSFLLGRPPFTELNIKVNDFPKMPELPLAGIPADLLAGRPDIRKAGLMLKSADWIVSAAKADRLPALSITASYTYGSDHVSTIFDNWIANLVGNLIGPVFDGGYRKAEVRRTKAVVKERLAAYKKAVFNAIREVEDALINEKKQGEYLNALNEQYRATLNTYKQALEYYRKGATDYINVLESLNSSQSLELSLIEAEYSLFRHRIVLYRALGGNWMRNNMKIRIRE